MFFFGEVSAFRKWRLVLRSAAAAMQRSPLSSRPARLVLVGRSPQKMMRPPHGQAAVNTKIPCSLARTTCARSPFQVTGGCYVLFGYPLGTSRPMCVSAVMCRHDHVTFVRLGCSQPVFWDIWDFTVKFDSQLSALAFSLFAVRSSTHQAHFPLQPTARNHPPGNLVTMVRS